MRLTIAANQGTLGGGEVMLFAIAQAARELGYNVTIVAPATPTDVADQARSQGFRTVAVDGTSTAAYLKNLRVWDAKQRKGLLWCNGLRPAFATAGHPNRVVELHQRPEGVLKALAKIATAGARRVIVPSHDMAADLPGSEVMWNWSHPVQVVRATRAKRPVTLGFLGRLSTDKGVGVLCEAVEELQRRKPGAYRVLLAGESRFVDQRDAEIVEKSLARLGEIVERRGWIRREEFFTQVDLAIFPSVWQEPFGLVVTEAMSAGVPFVISDAGALAEVAGDGYISQAGNPDSLADTIERASTNLDAYVEAGRRRWAEHFSPEAGKQRLAAMLASLNMKPEDDSAAPRVALVHDYLTQRGGAERVSLTLAHGFSGATLTTSLYDEQATFPEFADIDVRTTWLQRIPGLAKRFRFGLPLYPLAFSTTTVGQDADVVIASSTGYAHGVRTPAKKIVYCHSPARFLYLVEDYLGGPWWKTPVGWALMALRPFLVAWDQRAAKSAERYLANSTVVKERIRDVYGIEADVIHPPHAIDPGGHQTPITGVDEPFYLIVSRLMPYKNIDVAIAAFRAMPKRRLLIVGRGPLKAQLAAGLPSNVTMAQGLSDSQMRWAYAHATAVIAPSKEDFGLTPVEGFAFGTPALALRAGGYLDTVVEGVSGIFFDSATPAAIIDAVESLESAPLDADAIRRHGQRFSSEVFIAALRRIVQEVAR